MSSAAFAHVEDENDNPDMLKHAKTLEALTTVDGNPFVLVANHPAQGAKKNGRQIPRGASSYLGQIDGRFLPA